MSNFVCGWCKVRTQDNDTFWNEAEEECNRAQTIIEQYHVERKSEMDKLAIDARKALDVHYYLY